MSAACKSWGGRRSGRPMTGPRGHTPVYRIGGDKSQAAKTHCAQGHPFSEANTYIYRSKKGSVDRQCRACNAERKRRARAA